MTPDPAPAAAKAVDVLTGLLEHLEAEHHQGTRTLAVLLLTRGVTLDPRLLAQPAPAEPGEWLYRKVVTEGMTEFEPGMTQEEMETLPMEEWWLSAPPMPLTTIQYVKVAPAEALAELRAEKERLREKIQALATKWASEATPEGKEPHWLSPAGVCAETLGACAADLRAALDPLVTGLGSSRGQR